MKKKKRIKKQNKKCLTAINLRLLQFKKKKAQSNSAKTLWPLISHTNLITTTLNKWTIVCSEINCKQKGVRHPLIFKGHLCYSEQESMRH